MKKTFGGPAIFLDRADINTDEIIPAKYLTEVTKEALKPYCLEDLFTLQLGEGERCLAEMRQTRPAILAGTAQN